MRLLVVNGPNLNLLGVREPEVYGSTTLSQLEDMIRNWGASLDIEVDFIQSNAEADLIDAIQASDHDGIVINPGALTHTSRALADALAGVQVPAVEVHISNVLERERWRRTSVLTDVAVMSIYGRGLTGYRDALRHHLNRVVFDYETVTYGPHPANFGDLRRGEEELVVLVHGGFWRPEWALDTMESLAVDLTRRGFNTWNIEYRRLGAAVGWPAPAHDVLTALEHTPRLGLGQGPVTVIGHSAGGHLALWAGARARPPVKKIIGLAPVTDLAMHASSGLFGASEAQTLLDGGSPKLVGPGDVPAVLFHGTEDELVPWEQSQQIADDESVRFVAVAGGHFALLDPSRDPWGLVVRELTQTEE